MSLIPSIDRHFIVMAAGLFVLTGAVGCANTGTGLVAKPAAGQQLFYEDGREKLVSMQPGSIVSVRVADGMSGLDAFVVGIAKRLQSQVNISTDAIEAQQAGEALRVLSSEDVERKERQCRQTAAVARSDLLLDVVG